jgi:hypothetical protein
MTETERELIEQQHELLKEQKKLLEQQQAILEESIDKMKAHTDRMLDDLEAHIIKNREHIRDADSFLQEIARIRNGDLDVCVHKN